MSDTSPRIIAEATSNIVRSGEWIGVHGSVYSGDRKLRTAEVWLLINRRYVKCIPQTSWHSRFWFHVRLGAGTYALKAEGYKIMAEFTHKTREKGEIRLKKEYKVTSPTIRVVSAPRIFNPKRLLPFTYEVENWRKITLGEAIELSYKAAEIIVREYPDTSTVRLVGGTVQRGWTRRDIDLLINSRTLLREGGPVVPGWPSAVKSIRLEGEVEKAVAYPTTVFACPDKGYYPGEETAQIYPRTKCPAATTLAGWL